MRAKARRQSKAAPTQKEHAAQVTEIFATLHASENDLKSAASIDSGITNKFKGVDEFTNTV